MDSRPSTTEPGEERRVAKGGSRLKHLVTLQCHRAGEDHGDSPQLMSLGGGHKVHPSLLPTQEYRQPQAQTTLDLGSLDAYVISILQGQNSQAGFLTEGQLCVLTKLLNNGLEMMQLQRGEIKSGKLHLSHLKSLNQMYCPQHLRSRLKDSAYAQIYITSSIFLIF